MAKLILDLIDTGLQRWHNEQVGSARGRGQASKNSPNTTDLVKKLLLAEANIDFNLPKML